MMQITATCINLINPGTIIYVKDLWSNMCRIKVNNACQNWIDHVDRYSNRTVNYKNIRFYECTFLGAWIFRENMVMLKQDYTSITGNHIQCSRYYHLMFIDEGEIYNIENQMSTINMGEIHV